MAYGKKTGGREKGTPNEITKEIREVLQRIVSAELENLPGYISQISKPEVKAAIFIWEIYVSEGISMNFGRIAFTPGNYSFLDFFYFSMTTFFTVGYGDIVALSPFVKSVVILKILTSLFLVYAFINNYGQLTNET